MTETTATITDEDQMVPEVPPAEPTETNETEDEQQTPAPGAETRSKGNSEAAKYRRQLRDTEAERDQLQTELRDLRRQIDMERHKIPAEYEYLLRTDGTDEDFQKSLEDVSRLINRPGVVPESGTGSGDHGEGPSWSDAFRGE